jgi:hypothetical protein
LDGVSDAEQMIRQQEDLFHEIRNPRHVGEDVHNVLESGHAGVEMFATLHEADHLVEHGAGHLGVPGGVLAGVGIGLGANDIVHGLERGGDEGNLQVAGGALNVLSGVSSFLPPSPVSLGLHAFSAGWGIGRQIDEATGASDFLGGVTEGQLDQQSRELSGVERQDWRGVKGIDRAEEAQKANNPAEYYAEQTRREIVKAKNAEAAPALVQQQMDNVTMQGVSANVQAQMNGATAEAVHAGVLAQMQGATAQANAAAGPASADTPDAAAPNTPFLNYAD